MGQHQPSRKQGLHYPWSRKGPDLRLGEVFPRAFFLFHKVGISLMKIQSIRNRECDKKVNVESHTWLVAPVVAGQVLCGSDEQPSC